MHDQPSWHSESLEQLVLCGLKKKVAKRLEALGIKTIGMLVRSNYRKLPGLGRQTPAAIKASIDEFLRRLDAEQALIGSQTIR